MRWMIVPFLVITFASCVQAQTAKFINPLIPKFGPIVPLPEAKHQPLNGMKVVFDVTAAKSKEEVIPGLERVAVLLNLSQQANQDLATFHLVVVLHGDATRACLNEKAYREQFQTSNPSTELIGLLKKHGVKIYVCGQALARKKLDTKWVMPNVEIATSAMTAVINLQMAGYAYLPAH